MVTYSVEVNLFSKSKNLRSNEVCEVCSNACVCTVDVDAQVNFTLFSFCRRSLQYKLETVLLEIPIRMLPQMTDGGRFA